MSKYEFVISAKDKTAQAFSAINKNIGGLTMKAGAAAAAVAGVTATFAALTNRAVRNARELDAQAKLAGLNAEEFQALSYAFGQFNISQEKFADISKDVQDKLGDFLATGAGPFKDFFEQVAPKVGLTANALRDLSSTDVLIAVKKAMDDANVSAKEQVFYMEAIANDATLLLPALQDNGKAIKDLSEEYRGLNLAISQTEIDKVKDLSKEMALLDGAVQRFENKFALYLSEPIADLVDLISSGWAQAVMFMERDFTQIDMWLTNAKVSWLEFKDAIGGDVDTNELRQLQAEAERLENIYDRLTRKLNGEQEPPVAYSGGYGETDDIFAGMENPFDAGKAVSNINQGMEQVRNTFLDNLSLIDEVTANSINFDNFIGEQETNFWTNFEQQGFATYQNLGSANQTFWDQWLAAAETNLQSFDELSAFTIESFSNQMGDALESIVFDSESLGDAFQGVMQGIARSVVNALGQMAAQWLAYKLVQMAVGSSTAIAGAAGMGANAQAASLQAGINAFASTAAIPIVGPAMAPAAMSAALAVTQPMAFAIKGLAAAGAAASFEGGGYTWDGARIGGIDGKGGKLAIMHPREKIIDLTKPESQQQSGQVRETVVMNFNAPTDRRWFENNRSNIEAALFGRRGYRK